MTRPTAPSYRHVAGVYDLLATGYSLGAIDRAKALHHSLITEGDRVLYAGAGRGREIVGACQRGARVTCVESDPAMAEALHNRLGKSGCDGFTIVPRPIQAVPADPVYDLVVAHFFLNVFNAKQMPSVLAHLCSFVKPGGRIVIADFRPGKGKANLQTAYYRPVNLAGWLLRICALHPIYDYAPLLAEKGLTVEQRTPFGWPGMYEVVVASSEHEA